MKCRINYNNDGTIESVNDESGNRSQTFDSLVQITGDKSKALDLYSLSETEDFKNSKKDKKERIRLKNEEMKKSQVENFASLIGAQATDRPGVFKYTDGNSSYYFKSVGDKVIGDGLIETPVENRGKGFARNLMEDFVKKAGSQGLSVKMFVSPRDKSTTELGLKKFYKSLGFQFDGTNFEMLRKPKRSDREGEFLDKINFPKLETIQVDPTVKEILTFASPKNGELVNQSVMDIKNTMHSFGLTSYGELLNKMETGLLNNGIILFTKESLQKSGLYNEYEMNSILNNLELQDSIRNTYQALKNIDNKTFEQVDPSFVVKTSKINSLGKQEILNPYKVQEEVIFIVAGKNVDEVIDQIPYDSVKNNYKNDVAFKKQLDEIANTNRNLSSKKIELGEITDKTQNNNRELFEKTLDLSSSDKLVGKINYLSSISDEVWNQSGSSIYDLLKDFNDSAVSSGIDFINLEDKAYTKDKNDVLELLDSFRDVLASPSEDRLDHFFDTYTDFFEIDNTPVNQTVKTQEQDNIYLDTGLSEYELFDKFNLIKESNSVYKYIEPTEDVEEAYQILFENKDKLPSNIQTLEELKSHVLGILNNYDASSFDTDPVKLESLILHKIYFNSPIKFNEKQDSVSRDKFSRFSGDYNFLTQEFASHFYSDYIREKRANTDAFKNYYSNFNIDEKGITLKSNDPITIANMIPYVDESMRMYNMISKNLNLPLEDSFEDLPISIDEMEFKREYAISNPNSVPKLKGDFSRISKETIAVKNETEPIIRTLDGLYEVDYQIGEVMFYNKLPEGDTNYNSYGQYKAKSESSIDVREYGFVETIPDTFFKAKNYYSKEELEEINKKYFPC